MVPQSRCFGQERGQERVARIEVSATPFLRNVFLTSLQMLYKKAMPLLATSDRMTLKRQRNMRIGQSIVGFAVVYPFLVYGIAWSYALAHSRMSKPFGAFLLLLAFPISLGCAFSLIVFIADGRGKKRVAGIVGSLAGIALRNP